MVNLETQGIYSTDLNEYSHFSQDQKTEIVVRQGKERTTTFLEISEGNPQQVVRSVVFRWITPESLFISRRASYSVTVTDFQESIQVAHEHILQRQTTDKFYYYQHLGIDCVPNTQLISNKNEELVNCVPAHSDYERENYLEYHQLLEVGWDIIRASDASIGSFTDAHV